LNRDGLANGSARAFLFEVPARSEKSKAGRRIGPYTAEAVASGGHLARSLAEVYREQGSLSALAAFAMLRSDEQVNERMVAALQPAAEPFPRALDVHGLFSTEPDVFGGFTDVSEFIRGEDPRADVTVFWREFDAGKPLPRGDALDGPAYHVEQGCAVPIDRLRKFIEGKGVSFVWDDHTDAWQKCSATDLCPGMIVMLSRQSGGYDASQGWTGSASTRLDDVPPPGAFEEEFRSDPFSELGEWVAISDHLGDVRREVERIGFDLKLCEQMQHAVVSAAEHHDIGKALEQWQGKLPHPAPNATGQWAKAPFLFAVRPAKLGLDVVQVEAALSDADIRFRRATPRVGSRVANCCLWHTSKRVRDTQERRWLSEIRKLDGVEAAWMVPFRPGLRHEAASALALWHQYFRQSARFPGLVIYLVAAHHGKVRTVLTARTRGVTMFAVCPESGLSYQEIQPGIMRCLDLPEEAPLPIQLSKGEWSYDDLKNQRLRPVHVKG